MFDNLDEKTAVHASDLFPQIDISGVLTGTTKILGDLIRIKQTLYTINCVCAGDTGAVITFTNISKIQELEGQIRTKLHKKGLVAKYTFSDVIGKEQKVLDAVATARKFARVNRTFSSTERREPVRNCSHRASTTPRRAMPILSSPSTVRLSRKTCLRANCSDTSTVPSPEQ